MSQLLVRIAKISSSSIVKKQHGLCFSEFRRSLSTAATPYLLFQETDMDAMTLSCEPLVELNLIDPRKEETVTIPNQTLTKELLTPLKVGSSRGWVVTRDLFNSKMHLTNMFNPCASASSRKAISLPTPKHPIHEISLSASPDQEDCVVAGMAASLYLSMCRPGDSDWTPIQIPYICSGGMIYSERDCKFYLNRKIREKYNGPIDFVDTGSGFPQVSLCQSFPLSHIPQSRVQQLSTTKKTKRVQHIVESPSGEIFIVHWYNEYLNREEIEAAYLKNPPYHPRYTKKPRGFLVFRQDPEQMIGSYTEDIGDLCIFLGYNEAFCLSATEYPGLKPNSIYFADFSAGFGFYDLSSNTLHEFINPPPAPCCHDWLAPLQ